MLIVVNVVIIKAERCRIVGHPLMGLVRILEEIQLKKYNIVQILIIRCLTVTMDCFSV